MPGAKIRIDQPSGAGTGTAGLARSGLWNQQAINLVSTLAGNTSYLWELLDIPTGSSATLTNATSATATFTPDQPGTYLVRLTTNGQSTSGNVQTRLIGVTKDNAGATVRRGWRFPAFGEMAEHATGLSVKGWAEALETIFTDLLAGSLPVGASGTVLAGTGASSNFTSTPTVSGLTIGTLTGVLKATAGVVAAATLSLSDLPQGTTGTVLAGVTSSSPVYSSTPTLTAVKFGTTPATTGCIRTESNTTIAAFRNSGTDYNAVSVADDTLTFGGSNVPSLFINAALTGSTYFRFDTASDVAKITNSGLYFLTNDGAAIYGGDADGLGTPFKTLSWVDTTVYLGDGVNNNRVMAYMPEVGTFGFYTDNLNLIMYGDTTDLNILASSTCTSVTYYISATLAAKGATMYLLAQNAATTGGDLILGSGSGGTANGSIYLRTGGVDRMQLSPTGKYLTFVSSLTGTVGFYQQDITTNSATGAAFAIQAQNATGTTTIGGKLQFYSGTGTTRSGYIEFYHGSTQRGQIGSGSSGNGGIWWGRSNTASGNDSTCIGVSNTTSNNYAIAIGASNSSSGSVSVCIGGFNIATADYSVCVGYSNTTSVFAAMAFGNQNTASGNSAFAVGILNTAANVTAIAMGYYAYAASYGEVAHASGNASGNPQNSRVQVSGVTAASASASVNLMAGPSADQEIITRSNRIYSVDVWMVATSASFTNVGRLKLTNALIKNNSGTVTVIDAGDVEGSTTTPTDWGLALSGSGTNLRLTFSKTAGTNALRCSALVQLVDVQKA